MESAVRSAFFEQAVACCKMGSPFTGCLSAMLGVYLTEASAIGSRVLHWPGDPSYKSDSVPLRLIAGLNAIAQRDSQTSLAGVFPPAATFNADILWPIVQDVLTKEREFLNAYLDNPPQTNEIGRSAPLVAGLLLIAQRFQLPLALYEIGSSAGLNLIPDQYRYRFGSCLWGPNNNGPELMPKWEGKMPPLEVPLTIQSRRGVDIRPIDITDPSACARLMAYVWPDQAERRNRLNQAITTARDVLPQVDKGDAGDWVIKHIQQQGSENTVRVLYHSIVWSYLSEATQKRITKHMISCGNKANDEMPLAWLRYEMQAPAGDAMAKLILTTWPDGKEEILATGHAHGNSVTWLL